MENKKYKLPKGFAEKWVAELRSGKYGQIRGSYFSYASGCYCGLGISLLVIGARRIGALDVDLGDEEWPLIQHETLGLKSKIQELNDDLGYTFLQQADWIETNVEFIP